ncbi:MAG: glycosyltransferase family 4 protein [Calothrix sp. C42_A2020_038]|nr:glycosyltransferase family 4 protein [Calothrix sp. C42_A2020_038]
MKILMLGESLERQGGIVSVEKLILQEALSNTSIKLIPTLPKGSAIKKLLVFSSAVVQLVGSLLANKADVIHIHISEGGSAYRHMITALITLIFQKPVIMHAHSCNFHEFYPKLPSLIQVWMSWIFSKSTRFIVLSESWKKFYVDNLKLKVEQVTVLPNPVRLPSQVPERQNSSTVSFVFLGRIGQRKGAFDLISAFAKLSEKHKQRASLTLAGDGEGEKARDLVKSLELTSSINILDWVNQTQRDELLNQANVFVLPSYNEGLPMALIEAMSWSLPVITTPVGGIPELVINYDNGLLVNPGDIQQLSDAIESLIKDEQLRLMLGQRARASVAHLDIVNYMNSLTKIYSLAFTGSPAINLGVKA